MNRLSVLIAGGGVAALEALLRLRRLADDRVSIRLLAPNEDFAYRALSVGEPFSLGAAERHPLAPLVAHADAEWVKDTLRSVELERRIVHTGNGEELPFDALVVAVGARPRAVVDHARTFDDAHADELLRGLVQDIEGGYVKKVAFVSPPGPVHPLPLYELALMAAQNAYDAGVNDFGVDLITAEPRPLPTFGAQVGAVVGDLLSEAGIRVHTSTEVKVPSKGHLVLSPSGTELTVNSIVALPQLIGPSIGGIPGRGAHGFIPVDSECAVPGTDRRVFVVGDAMDFPVKQGGVGAQAADVASDAIARAAGAEVDVPPFRPVVQGKLLTGAGPKYLFARYIGGEGFDATITDLPAEDADRKVAAAELAPYLEQAATGV
jgi:sulfide:quinone oxidoreductase